MNPTKDQREHSILDAAVELIVTGGVEAVSMASLGEQTGLSRPAIYQYFASREHVLGELLINELADLSNEIDRLVIDLEPMEQVRVWVHYSLAHLSSKQHKIVRQISMDNLPQEQRGMMRAMHGYIMLSLVTPLTTIGIKDPSSLCELIFSTVAASAKRIEEGNDFVVEARALERFVIAGIESAQR